MFAASFAATDAAWVTAALPSVFHVLGFRANFRPPLTPALAPVLIAVTAPLTRAPSKPLPLTFLTLEHRFLGLTFLTLVERRFLG